MTKGLGTLKKNVLIKFAISGGVLLLFVFLLFLPQYGRTQLLRSEVENLSKENERIQTMVISTEKTGEKLQSIQNQLRKYQGMLPPRGTLSNVLDKIASRAQVDGLQVFSIKPLRDLAYAEADPELLKNHGQKIIQVVISISAQGRYGSLGRYISHLENSPYKILIREVIVQNMDMIASQEGKEPELTIDLTLGILMKVPQETVIQA
ncbi:MAG: type 4a pilus biogenesis protein PilO [Candidatus Omnitrophica bacterium]|nr:type 4a pilus biogenesis protein PilO [Candidatus Omnitrophota bacterium]MDD5670103.1 type 4a pilus biogenesis protein PilO [Candidatus Omnitrophota bacterium]